MDLVVLKLLVGTTILRSKDQYQHSRPFHDNSFSFLVMVWTPSSCSIFVSFIKIPLLDVLYTYTYYVLIQIKESLRIPLTSNLSFSNFYCKIFYGR